MLEWIVWAGGALLSVEGAYEQLGRTCIRNDTNITNPASKKPDWLQMKSTIQLGRNWAIHNVKAVISVFQQEASFRDASLACIHPLHTSRLDWAQSVPRSCVQFLCQQKATLVCGTHLFLLREGMYIGVFLPDISFGISRVFLQANCMQ